MIIDILIVVLIGVDILIWVHWGFTSFLDYAREEEEKGLRARRLRSYKRPGEMYHNITPARREAVRPLKRRIVKLPLSRGRPANWGDSPL